MNTLMKIPYDLNQGDNEYENMRTMINNHLDQNQVWSKEATGNSDVTTLLQTLSRPGAQ